MVRKMTGFIFWRRKPLELKEVASEWDGLRVGVLELSDVAP